MPDDGVWERFSQRGRRVVTLGQDAARELRHDHIGTEHLLLGLLEVPDGIAAEVLAARGIGAACVREQVVALRGSGTTEPDGSIVPFTPHAQQALEEALRESVALEHDYIGTEHLLLGLLQVGDASAPRLLAGLGAGADQLRGDVAAARARRLPVDPDPPRAPSGGPIDYSRFTERARTVIVLGQEAARELRHDHIGTEHLLLGLLDEREGLAAQTLAARGVAAAQIRARITAIVGVGDTEPDGSVLPYSHRVKRVLEQSLRSSITLGHAYLGTEHLLLGLLAVEGSVALRLLAGQGVQPEAMRADVIRTLREGMSRQPPPQRPDESQRVDGDGDSQLSLAQQKLLDLGVLPRLDRSYSPEDAARVLQGRAVDSALEDTIHSKLAWIVGVQVIGHINARHPGLGWTPDRVAVRTLLEGESSASFWSFPADRSYAVTVSRALQESLIRMANVVEYFDVSTGAARRSLRRGKRKQSAFDSSARVTCIFRYLLLGHRMLGNAPSAPAVLDSRSFDIAGTMAAGAVMFVVAHEIAHIAHGHETSSTDPYDADGRVTVSELQELQADIWALNFLKEFMSDDPNPENIALWCAFIALFAMQMTEEAVYVRRSRTHPLAFHRWLMLEKQSSRPDDRTRRLRLALMAAFAGASKLDEPIPEHLWPLLWKDQMLCVDPTISAETLSRWDHVQTCPLDSLAAEAERSATEQGKALLDALRRGDMSAALGRVVSSRRLATLLDPASALAFSTLKDAIEKASPAFTEGDRVVFSIAGARLAAEHLSGGSVDA